MNEKAIVLFSGGLDSTTTLAIAKNAGYDLLAISFNYGQQHEIELKRAKTIAGHMAIEEHRVVNKAEIIKKRLELGVNYGLTHSCYAPDETGLACGVCDSCLLRLKGFEKAGVEDPLKYC